MQGQGAGSYIVEPEGSSSSHNLLRQVVGGKCDVCPLLGGQLGVGREGLTLWACGNEGQKCIIDAGECIRYSLHANGASRAGPETEAQVLSTQSGSRADGCMASCS